MPSPGEQASAAMDWATLMNRPAAYIDPARLAACFGERIGTAICARLRDAHRLQDRLSDVISGFYGLAAPVDPDALMPVDRKIALLPAGLLNDLVRRAGAVYRANAIANVVRAEEVRQLREQLGEPLCAFALANRNLSGPPATFEAADAARIGAVIGEDGLRCLAAWCQSQPGAVAARVRVKMPPSSALDGPAQPPFDEIGPAIIRCAAS